MYSDNRVVITGIGLVTPLGNSPEAVWSRLASGESAVHALEQYPTGQGGATVRDFDPAQHVQPRRILKVINRATSFALAAARGAWADARLVEGDIAPERFGIYVGAGESEMQPESFLPGLELARDSQGAFDPQLFAAVGLEAIDPYIALTSLSNNALCYISIAHTLRGVNNNYVKSGVASSQALGEAKWAIEEGYADAVVVVGVDCLTDPLAITSYNSVGLLNATSQRVQQAMRPFDVTRAGFVPGEGAAALILENERVARRRGARVHGRVLGFGQATDTNHIIDPPSDGGRLPATIGDALLDANLQPEDLAVVIAHGNATVRGDLGEAVGIGGAVNGGLRTTPVTATKPLSGHLGAASGAVESVFGLLMLRHGFIPPIANLIQPDEGMPLNLVQKTGVHSDGRTALHIARGIGGQNAALVISID
jgi:3-oxoacyl-[acyl-carrier-protein] synthase II